MPRDRLHGAALISCALLAAWAVSGPFARAQARPTAGELTTRIATETDVRWLEDAVSSSAVTAEWPRSVRIVTAKAVRTLAYARLGELGTPESLTAIRRIEAEAMRITPAPLTVPADIWPHVGWHFSDTIVEPLAQTSAPDGTTYAIVSANLLGGFDFFLISSRAPADPRAWSRPKLVDRSSAREARDASLTLGAGDTLTFRSTAALDAGELQISLLEVSRDSDADGWTDVEEGRLGTDPHDPDSDGDGLPDGSDGCPLYAAAKDEAARDDAIVLRKAIFAAFGLTGSRQLLYVTPESPKVHVFGYGGPILFDHSIPKQSVSDPLRGPYVSWRIAERTATTARVELSDWEGPLAAGGQDVLLRKIGDTWLVVSRKMTWIS